MWTDQPPPSPCSGLDVALPGLQLALVGLADGVVERHDHLLLGDVLVGLGVPPEVGCQLQRPAEALDREVVTDHDAEVRAADDQLDHGVDTAGRRQHVVLALPGLRPDLAGDPDHVEGHLSALLQGEGVQRRTLAHDRPEGSPQTVGVDALGPVLVLVRPLDRLLEDDHPLERAARIRVELQHQVVGLALGIRLPVVQLVALGEVESAVDRPPQSLLAENLQTPRVLQALGRDHGEGPPLTLLGVEHVAGLEPVLAVIDGEVGPLHRRQHTILDLPVPLEVTADGIEHHGVGLQHRLGNLQHVLLVELAVHAVARLAEAVDLGDLHQLVGGDHEGEDLRVPLVDHADVRERRLGGRGHVGGRHWLPPEQHGEPTYVSAHLKVHTAAALSLRVETGSNYLSFTPLVKCKSYISNNIYNCQ